MDIFVSFLVSVVAGVISGLIDAVICKWFDNKKKK